MLLNTMAKTNKYSMILCVIILIDNYNRSRLGTTALISDKTKESFSWLFESLNRATDRLVPSLLYTDANSAIVAAARSLWPTTKHHFCLFHIRKNLEKHFLSKYRGEKWYNFFNTFCYACNSRIKTIFEERWALLIQEYSDAAAYLQCLLYSYREA